jgi:hypothetical protein
MHVKKMELGEFFEMGGSALFRSKPFVVNVSEKWF